MTSTAPTISAKAFCPRCTGELDAAGNCPICAAVERMKSAHRNLHRQRIEPESRVMESAGRLPRGNQAAPHRRRDAESGQDRALPKGDRE